MANKLEAFDRFFADGQKYEDDVRGIVVCPTFPYLRAMFNELADLVTVEGYVQNPAPLIRFRSGAQLHFVVGALAKDAEYFKGRSFTHMIVCPDVHPEVIAVARASIRSQHPTMNAGRNTISHA